ncbi:MAG TPA: SIMPL domain-containing protein [Kiritimatiellia bacterium]|nr:SIMPL domain-containing protein [Kiritimatiellia bacterium]
MLLLSLGAVAALLGASLVALLVGVSHAQVVTPPTALPLGTPYRAVATAPAASVAPAASLPRTIVVVGEGQVVARPQLARLEIGVETVAPTVAEAVELNEVALAKMNASLADYVAPEEIHTTSYNVYPERDYEAGGLAPIIGYHVTNMAQVTVRDLAALGDVLAAATEAGANQIYGVSYDLDAGARARAESEARALATASLRAHAAEHARLHQVRLGELISVSEAVGSSALTPYAYGEGAGGAGGPTITPGGLTVVVRLQATYALAAAAGQ